MSEHPSINLDQEEKKAMMQLVTELSTQVHRLRENLVESQAVNARRIQDRQQLEEEVSRLKDQMKMDREKVENILSLQNQVEELTLSNTQLLEELNRIKEIEPVRMLIRSRQNQIEMIEKNRHALEIMALQPGGEEAARWLQLLEGLKTQKQKWENWLRAATIAKSPEFYSSKSFYQNLPGSFEGSA